MKHETLSASAHAKALNRTMIVGSTQAKLSKQAMPNARSQTKDASTRCEHFPVGVALVYFSFFYNCCVFLALLPCCLVSFILATAPLLGAPQLLAQRGREAGCRRGSVPRWRPFHCINFGSYSAEFCAASCLSSRPGRGIWLCKHVNTTAGTRGCFRSADASPDHQAFQGH